MLDFHMHSHHSLDGEFSPARLMELCAEAGLAVVALSDHNSTRGCREGAEAAERLGIQFIPAVELDCRLDGVDLHMLGLGIDPEDPVIERIGRDVHRESVRTGAEMLDKLAAMGIHFDRQAVMAMARDGAITGEMVADVALPDPRNRDHPLLQPFYPGGDRSDNPLVNFELDLCSRPKIVHIHYISAAEAVEAIRGAGGFPVLAHPGYNLKGREELFEDIVRLGIGGVEAYSNYHSPDQTAFFLGKAREHGLLPTIGSDFHGRMKPAVRLGRVKEPFPAEELRAAARARGVCQ